MPSTPCIPTQTLVQRIYQGFTGPCLHPNYPHTTLGKLTRLNRSSVQIFLATKVSVYKSQVLRCTEPFPSSNASRGHPGLCLQAHACPQVLGVQSTRPCEFEGMALVIEHTDIKKNIFFHLCPTVRDMGVYPVGS